MMKLKRMAVFLIIALLVISSPVFAIDTVSTFKLMNQQNELVLSKEVSFQEGETLYDVTKKAFEIEESQGHIISINGIRSIPEKNIHWAAFVNGHFVQLSLDEVTLYANDEIVWALRDWNRLDILK
ncbi:DUF4430 domain-containing protein [Priestia abyssalis]|uniref:DUF4430 domain-containing protein n=1 Tax=Priestia abyssalis TaxID=1221450 RepID=UPI000994D2D0|nr:DUF4430 domain-containing protein [Priestia abyssalis]